MSPTRVTGLAVLLGSLLFAMDAAGQQQRQPYPPRPTAEAAKPVMEKVAKARADVSKAQGVANQAAAKVREGFESGAEWQAASAAQKQAQADVDAARKRVIDAVHDSAAYKQAQVTKKTADAELAQLKADNVGTDDLTQGATKAMNAGAALSKMEAEALAGDAKFIEAKKRLLDANAKLAVLGKQVDELVKADPAWQSARKEVDAAEVVKAQADKELAAAQAQDAQTLKQWQQQCAQI
ncbi:MAG: hypothetical protein ACHRHE_24730, partial [Tepidisphaerales bacterium]